MRYLPKSVWGKNVMLTSALHLLLSGRLNISSLNLAPWAARENESDWVLSTGESQNHLINKSWTELLVYVCHTHTHAILAVTACPCFWRKVSDELRLAGAIISPSFAAKLSPCYILLQTLRFTGTESALDSMTHLAMVTVQSAVYILPSTHCPLLFHSREGHQWREMGAVEGTYQINLVGSASRHRRVITRWHKETQHLINLCPICV